MLRKIDLMVFPALYHGTSRENAKILCERGWAPRPSGIYGPNLGNPRFLYVTTMAEDAQWFADRHQDGVVLAIRNIRHDDVIVDPEGGVGWTVEEELAIAARNNGPAKFALLMPTPSDQFSMAAPTTHETPAGDFNGPA